MNTILGILASGGGASSGGGITTTMSSIGGVIYFTYAVGAIAHVVFVRVRKGKDEAKDEAKKLAKSIEEEYRFRK